MPSVLIVEDEALTRSLLARLVSAIAGASALAAASLAEARALLDVATPDAAIIDLQLHDGFGFEVLQALDDRGGVALAIVISAHLDRHQRSLPASAARLRYMPKPIDPGWLREILVTSLPQSAAPHGPFSPVEYVQIAGSGRHSVELSCLGPAGARLGSIHMLQGRVWRAHTPAASGPEAFRELIIRSDARVRVEPVLGAPGAANVDQDWQAAILATLAPGVAEAETSHSAPVSGVHFDLLPSVRPTGAAPAGAALASGVPAGAALASRAPAGTLPAPRATSGTPAAGAVYASAAPAGVADEPAGAADPVELGTGTAELTELAVRAIVAADYALAVRALERALQLEPGNASVRHQLRRLYQLPPPKL